MGRFLKKLSSLCLALVLGTSGFFSLNANAARVTDPVKDLFGVDLKPEDIKKLQEEFKEITRKFEEFKKLEKLKKFEELKQEWPADILVINSKLSRPILRISFHNKQKIPK